MSNLGHFHPLRLREEIVHHITTKENQREACDQVQLLETGLLRQEIVHRNFFFFKLSSSSSFSSCIDFVQKSIKFPASAATWLCK